MSAGILLWSSLNAKQGLTNFEPNLQALLRLINLLLLFFKVYAQCVLFMHDVSVGVWRCQRILSGFQLSNIGYQVCMGSAFALWTILLTSLITISYLILRFFLFFFFLIVYGFLLIIRYGVLPGCMYLFVQWACLVLEETRRH